MVDWRPGPRSRRLVSSRTASLYGPRRSWVAPGPTRVSPLNQAERPRGQGRACRKFEAASAARRARNGVVLPDESREGVARRFRELSQLIEQALPKQVDSADLPGWPELGFLLLARLSGHARTLAELVAAERDLDARVITRSLFEHSCLLAWLAIGSDGAPEPTSSAQAPEVNVQWWVGDQLKREQRSIEIRTQKFDQPLTAELREQIRLSKPMQRRRRSLVASRDRRSCALMLTRIGATVSTAGQRRTNASPPSSTPFVACTPSSTRPEVSRCILI